ncbi:MAG: Flagellar protein FliT [Pseudomonadota bacterium]|jgi:hypothetical protein
MLAAWMNQRTATARNHDMIESAPTHISETGAVRARFQAVEAHARFMLAAARMSDWPLFWQLERECAELIQDLKACRTPVHDVAWSAERHELMLRLLHTDASIRELLPVQRLVGAPTPSGWMH